MNPKLLVHQSLSGRGLMKNRLHIFALVSLTVALGSGCSQVRAKSAFRDGNKYYKEENYKRAILEYQRAVELSPNMPEAIFYLGSSHQALYRPGKDAPDNKEHLDKAIEYFKKAIEVNDAGTDTLKKVKQNTLAALTAIYADDPYKDFAQAQTYAQQ